MDLEQPFIIEYDMGPPLGVFSNEYAVPAEVLVLERQRNAPVVTTTPETKDEDPARPPSALAIPVPVEAQAEPEAAREEERPAPLVTTPAAEPEAAPVREDVFELAAPTIVEEDTALSRLFTGIVWSKVAPLLALFAVVLYAFLRKNPAARWLALAGTTFYLGFVDGGFLSISHITSGITAGLSVYVSDLPLLLIVTFTVVTTLLWGRVLCGFLCPFGALQDFLERIVPRRFQRKIPQRIHDRAIYIKYAILALIVVLAVVASEVSIFQYFEPFGTVFFLSPSIVLWGIAIAIL
ncbi:MAG: 4Fe-4S binding protein, partial [Planctomycetes bacterium]|nr:4Fe-4S binding protein [Planctomycetota bacterium]